MQSTMDLLLNKQQLMLLIAEFRMVMSGEDGVREFMKGLHSMEILLGEIA